jgi:type II secretory pathway pseudopilin PulG
MNITQTPASAAVPPTNSLPWERRPPAGTFPSPGAPTSRQQVVRPVRAPTSRRPLEFEHFGFAPNPDAKGVAHTSPGQRPGDRVTDVNCRLKACFISAFWVSRRRILSPERPIVSPANFRRALISPASRSRAFTMIEIAISLAIIGFALVAIVGILPIAMNAQRDNRQETIINQDASILMDAVRNGERGLDDLTNYVVAITNYVSDYTRAGAFASFNVWGFTPSGTTLNGGASSVHYPLTNGYSIIGLLSTPKILVHPGGVGFTSNHVVAVFRSLSGPASEKPPQVNPTMQEMALSYKVIADVSAYSTNFYDPSWTNSRIPGLSPIDSATRSNYMILVQTLQTNVHDLRLTFLWPLLPSGKIGSGRQVYRTMVAGGMVNGDPFTTNGPFWFFQPRTYY